MANIYIGWNRSNFNQTETNQSIFNLKGDVSYSALGLDPLGELPPVRAGVRTVPPARPFPDLPGALTAPEIVP